ncbi:MAG: NAD(P)/FAD-dependent oxidoreductase [Burkholderiales bacterium]|jgi:all-trans-retinol 13,14-reductase|nr:MAG: NAD(P)/FAD-dependent oxidoreductase [Burkholderiales bacterium]
MSTSAPATTVGTSKPKKVNCPRIGLRFRDWRLKGPYDAVVIGSGMGGLTTAAMLSAMGWKVAVLEQHYTAGGYTHSYEREGYEWDVGLHYVGDMDARTQPRKLMDFLTGGRLQWAAMGQVYDRFFIGDKVFDAVAGKQAFRDELVRRFPQEAAAIDRYMALLAQVKKAVPLFTMARLLKPWQRAVVKPCLGLMLPRTLNMSTGAVLSEITQNPELIAVLTAQWGDYGLPPSQSSFLIHALVASHYLHGGYYPVGGSWRIAEAILPQIRAAGGEVFTYARVKQIIVEQGQTKGVLMEDGTRIDCACVISSAGVVNTFQHLVPAAEVQGAGYDTQLKQVKPSAAHLGVYVGLKHTAEELALPKTNFWIYPGHDYDGVLQRFMDDPEQPFPVVYISFPSAKDPDFARRYPGKATIEIVAPTNYAWFERWQDTIWGKRGEDYDAAKARWGERLMEVLYEKLPQLRGKVDYFEVSTPLSTNWFGGYQRGELYGLDHDPSRFQQDWLSPRTRIKGLWLTGQDVLTCGIVGAMMGGILTSVAVAGMRRMGPVLKRAMTGQPASPVVTEGEAVERLA